MNTTKVVVEKRPEKKSGPQGIWTYDTGAGVPTKKKYYS